MECFAVYSNEIEGRIDCHFYKPEFTKLDKRIRSITSKKLGDFIISISGGATPDIKESEHYYTNAAEGIPFLRVQNVTPEGFNLQKVKFINKRTHNESLKRSQVKEFNLLTKITGVGRMAISSVAPNNFIGNINQHLVVIQTQGEEVSKVIATFLNSDIGEKLASKRSTGGTRPALDYKALKSIPIVFKPEIVQIMINAYKIKKQKEAEAQQLLDSIDEFVLNELGIELPEFKDKMCYTVNSEEIENNRLDSYYYQPKFEEMDNVIEKGKYVIKELKEIADKLLSGRRPKGGVRQISEGIPSLGGEHVLDDGSIATINLKYIPFDFHENILSSKIYKKDILIVKDGATTGKVGIVPENYPFEETNINEHVFLLRVKEGINPYYIFSLTKSQIGQMQINRDITGGTIMGIIRETTESIKIPLPPSEIQNKIAEEVKRRMQKAERLQKEAKQLLEEAKEKVEEIILSE